MSNAAPLPRVLLVDDDRELTAMLSEYLGREGFEAAVAHDGEEALARLTEPGGERLSLSRRSTARIRATSSRGLKGLAR